jgi:short-subunit dehydrogenase
MPGDTWQSFAANNAVITTLAGLGTIYALKQLSGIASFTYTHFLRPSSLKRYNSSSDGKSPASWALVTGASDGIGKGFAEELCNRGFNVILHGRNETKLNAVKQELLKQWPKSEIKLLIIDAGSETGDTAKLEAAAESLKGLDLRVLVNNVGGGGGVRPVYMPLHKTTGDRTQNFVDINLRFPTEITRVMLPLLIQHSPALILNIGSIGGDIPGAYIAVYSGSKAYNKAWSASLGAELKAEGHDVEVKLIQTGIVSSGSEPRELSFMIPSSRAFAKHSLDLVGNGDSLVYGWWPHQVQHKVVASLPSRMMEKIVSDILKKEKENEEKKSKEQ